MVFCEVQVGPWPSHELDITAPRKVSSHDCTVQQMLPIETHRFEFSDMLRARPLRHESVGATASLCDRAGGAPKSANLLPSLPPQRVQPAILRPILPSIQLSIHRNHPCSSLVSLIRESFRSSECTHVMILAYRKLVGAQTLPAFRYFLHVSNANHVPKLEMDPELPT